MQMSHLDELEYGSAWKMKKEATCFELPMSNYTQLLITSEVTQILDAELPSAIEDIGPYVDSSKVPVTAVKVCLTMAALEYLTHAKISDANFSIL